MNKQNNKPLRTIALLIVTLLMSVCLVVTLGACDKKNTTESESAYETLFYKAMGYCAANYSDSSIYFVLITSEYKDYDSLIEQNGNGYLGYCYTSGDDAQGAEEFCIVYIYDSEENATNNVQKIREASLADEYVYQVENFIISETSNELFNTIQTCSFPSEIITSQQKKFIQNAVHISTSKTSLNNNKYIAIVIDLHNNKSENEENSISGIEFHTQTDTKIGNCFEGYSCISFNLDNEDIGVSNRFPLTNSSYDKIENGTRYIYSKIKPGVVFEKNSDGISYGVINYFFNTADTANLIIPAEHNGKPVVSINHFYEGDYTDIVSITIPTSVTHIDNDFSSSYWTSLSTINYKGTKAQWKAITKGHWWSGTKEDIVIHCSDGNLNKYGDEI